MCVWWFWWPCIAGVGDEGGVGSVGVVVVVVLSNIWEWGTAGRTEIALVLPWVVSGFWVLTASWQILVSVPSLLLLLSKTAAAASVHVGTVVINLGFTTGSWP